MGLVTRSITNSSNDAVYKLHRASGEARVGCETKIGLKKRGGKTIEEKKFYVAGKSNARAQCVLGCL